jgi:predicted small lipoprotein YifL
MWRPRRKPGRGGWKNSENRAEDRISLQLRGFPALALARQSLYGAARIGDGVVNRKLSPTRSGWAVIVLSAAALTLAGCGRKGGLDLPPTASGAPTASAAPASTDTATDAASKPSLFSSTYGTDAPPAAAKGTKQPFILDPLLGDDRPNSSAR